MTAATDGQGHVLWLGPDEWLVVAREGAPSDVAAAIEAALREAAAGAFLTTVDVSANRVGIEIAGPDALELLAAGCALDLERAPAGRRLRPDAARPRQRRPVARDRRPGAALPRARPALVRALPCGVASGRARGVTRKGRT